MKLSDIIRTNSDRLFIVDTECFIIFTGSSITDNRPFIRIGTWKELPVEIIPLVENIIISDRILGNPAVEQFNIDVRNLSSNRYIGGESILKRFLDYQRNFGLDLTNVSVVNIEKDIPELPDKKSISDRDQFIGVFYSDGNVKIVHDGSDIFDLNSIYNENLNYNEILGKISRNCKGVSRYSGAGFVVSDKNPVFYSDGYFTSYQFPGTSLSDFSSLEIDPGRIRELLLPSHNIIHVSDILKFKHAREGKIRIFSDNRDQVDLFRKLFKGATIYDEPFSDMNYSTGSGMTITAKHNTPNIRVTWGADPKRGKPLSLFFIKSPSEVKSILKENSDAIVISYTAYEQSVLLFKSVEIPVIILNDGNPNLRKISGTDHIILKAEMQYDFKNYTSSEELKNSINVSEDLTGALNNDDVSLIESWFEKQISDDPDYPALLNNLALLKLQMNSTKDRKQYSSLRNLIQKYSQTIPRFEPEDFNKNCFIEIAILNNSSYQIARKISRTSETWFTDMYSESSMASRGLDSDQHRLGRRIIEDRERLARILALFYEDRRLLPTFQFIRSELNLLKNEIDSRREIYSTEHYDSEYLDESKKNISSSRKKQNGKETSGVLAFLNDSDTGKESFNPGEIFRKYKIPSAILLAVIIVLTAALLIFKPSPVDKPVLTEKDLSRDIPNQNIVVTVARVDAEEKKLLSKHDVKITDYDIFRYANDVAIKNGYSGLSFDGFKEKNPHWIYPSNVFIMLDGEKVVVQKGDTLWDLAHAKLEKMNAEFYKIIDKLDKPGSSDRKKIEMILTEADRFIYTAQQKKFIENYRSKNLKDE